MDRNKRVTIFLTLVALSIIAGIGLVIYMAYAVNYKLVEAATEIQGAIKDNSKLKDTTYLNRDINHLKAYALRYEPTDIDFSIDDTLNTFDLKYIYSRNDKESVIQSDEIASIMLLKLYISHLKNYHQGYDLMSMKKGQAKYIIDYYFRSYGVDTTSEMYSTGFIYGTIKNKKNNSKVIVDYLRSIEPEQKRIENYFEELQRKNP